MQDSININMALSFQLLKLRLVAAPISWYIYRVQWTKTKFTVIPSYGFNDAVLSVDGALIDDTTRYTGWLLGFDFPM